MNCKIIIPVLAALAVASCGGRGGNGQPAGPGFSGAPGENVTPSVEVVTASARDVAQESTYSSSVEAYATNNIMPQSGARIRKNNVEVGDYVVKGRSSRRWTVSNSSSWSSRSRTTRWNTPA